MQFRSKSPSVRKKKVRSVTITEENGMEGSIPLWWRADLLTLHLSPVRLSQAALGRWQK